MSLYQILCNKLSKFSIIDFILVKLVYFLIGILITSLYIEMTILSIWFYIVLIIAAYFPLFIETISYDGNLITKMNKYIETNTPAKQILTFFSCFGFGIVLSILCPSLIMVDWYIYAMIIIILAIKPAHKTLFW